MSSGYAHSADAEGTFLGHPKGLYVLFFTEMWERFSYYGMRALLIFYLVQHWLFSDAEASIIYGAYTALVYITPVIGGYIADRYLGQRKAVLFGAVLLTLGHFLMAFEGDGGQADPAISIFWLALAFIIVGAGFLKANISVMVGQLYPRTDMRRDGAYTIFYMGINLGAALGAIIAGYLGQTFGWAYGFGAAGFGMLFGLLVFMWGKPYLVGPRRTGRSRPTGAHRSGHQAGMAALSRWRRTGGRVLVHGATPVASRFSVGLVRGCTYPVCYLLFGDGTRTPRPRPHLCCYFLDNVLHPVLGPIRTDRLIPQPVHRPLRGP